VLFDVVAILAVVARRSDAAIPPFCYALDLAGIRRGLSRMIRRRRSRRLSLAAITPLICAATIGPLCSPVLGQSPAPTVAQTAVSQTFAAFVAGLRPEARAFGVSDATFDKAFAGLAPDTTLPDLVLPGQTRAQGTQAEFSKTPLEYLNASYLLKLAADGRGLAVKHAASLAQIERELGVDRATLLAIWGRETAYGQAKLTHNPIRVLATQAWLGRRKDLFRSELLHALKMIQDGILDPATMKASWAGAVGLTQFMPSEYAALAYDLDKDGRKDIWTSVPDALASAANQLKAKGWTAGQPWGVEIVPSAAATCLAEGPSNIRPAAEWLTAGVVPVAGKSIPQKHRGDPAFILTPGGAYGPTFLVFENFMVLKRYNFADLYAVFVGHLSDRITGGADFAVRWTTPKLLSNRDIEDVQQRLQAQGYSIEKIDGKAGMNTRTEIGRYQKAAGLRVDCWPSDVLLAHLKQGKKPAP
jgi:lytic murein transglycosylase